MWVCKLRNKYVKSVQVTVYTHMTNHRSEHVSFVSGKHPCVFFRHDLLLWLLSCRLTQKTDAVLGYHKNVLTIDARLKGI